MSAGGLSYDCLTTNRRVTLPSVEMWGTNMNILKDPNKGIFTRRKDRVGDTQGILLAQENSGDRVAECINVYARGVNPMVSVSYDNYGNNAGSRSSVLQGSGGVRLPYRAEVIRPPIVRQEQLMPLSRQPREWFYALTNPVLPNILSQMSCPETRFSTHATTKDVSAITNIQYEKNSAPMEDQNYMNPKDKINKIEKNPQRKYQTQKLGDHGSQYNTLFSLDPKHFTAVNQFERESGISQSSRGSAYDIREKEDTSAVHDNKLLYAAFSSKSGNKNIGAFRDHIKTLQNRAVMEEILRPKPVINISDPNYFQSSILSRDPTKGIQENLLSSCEATTNFSGATTKNSPFLENYADPNSKIIQNVLHSSTDGVMGGEYTKEGEHDFQKTHTIIPDSRFGSWVTSTESRPGIGSELVNALRPKESSNPRIHTEATAQPTATHFWKALEPSHQASGRTRADQDIIRTSADARPQNSHHDSLLRSETMNKVPERSLPRFSTDSRAISDRTKNVSIESLGPGKIDLFHENQEYEGRPSQPDTRTSLESFQNAPVRVREDVLHIPVTAMIGNSDRRGGLDEVMYNDSSFRRGIQEGGHDSIQADTAKSYYEKSGELGARQNNPRRTLLLENTETVHNRTAMGRHVYETQSTNAQSYVNQHPQSGSFEALGSAVPRFERHAESGTEMPVSDKFVDVKKKAAMQFSDRFNSHPYNG